MWLGHPFPCPFKLAANGKCMTEGEQSKPEPGRDRYGRTGEPRKTRGIRFTQSEWEKVRMAAERRNISAAEFVRATILDVARDTNGIGTDAKLADLAPLIERTFRYAYILATLKRDEMLRDGRGDEVEDLIAAAREVQDSVQRQQPSLQTQRARASASDRPEHETDGASSRR